MKFMPHRVIFRMRLACLVSLLFLPLGQAASVQTAGDGITPFDSDWQGKGWWATAEQIDPAGYSRAVLMDEGAGEIPREPHWRRVRVPGNLVKTDVLKAREGRKTAWYRKVFIFSGSADVPYAIKLGEIQDCDRTYLNGRLIGETGDWSSSFPQAYDKERVYIIPANLLRPHGTNILLVQTRGYFPQISGIAKGSTALGPAAAILNERHRESLVSIIFLACYATVGLYFLFLFLRRRQGRDNLYFALFVFGLVFYQLLRSQLRYDTGFPFHVMKKIEYLQLFLLIPTFYTFIRNFYLLPKTAFVKWFDRVMLIPLAVAGAAFMGVLFSESTLVWDRINVLFVIKSWVFYLAAILGIVIYHVSKKNLDALFMLCGLLFMLAAILFDLAVYHDLVNAPEVTGYVFFVFILSIALILANRFVQLQRESDRFSEVLAQKNRELMRLDELKDEFLANTTHELRTPLHGIIGIAETMYGEMEVSGSAMHRNNISMIVLSARRLYNLVNDLLDFSKLKHKSIELDIKPIDLKMMTGVVITMTRHLVGVKKLDIVNRMPDGLPSVAADENRIQQILINLLGNAIKFTESGEISVTAGVADDMVSLSITDTGIGIPPDKEDRIFESFEQADGSVARVYGGTGLGLTISRQLVEKHGGSLSVESVVGKGSTFTFTVPVYHGHLQTAPLGVSVERFEPDQVAIGDKEMEAEETGGEDVYNILLVDDDPINLQVLHNYLSSRKYRLFSSQSGQKAIDMVRENRDIDMILLDIMMPRMSGYEVCQYLRGCYSLHELPILFLTAKNQVLDIVAGFDAGANDYLSKPFDRRELMARVDTLLTLKKAIKEQNRLMAIEKEIEIARHIQQSILPDRSPLLPWVDMHVRYTPMQLVGGDFYDFHVIDENMLGVIISDISGHGIPAALIAAMVKVAFSTQRSNAGDTSRLLAEMNGTLMGKCEERFATAAYVLLDNAGGRLICSNGGHPPVLVHRRGSGELVRVKPKGGVLGVWGDMSYGSESIAIEKGDRVILYTDGIVECADESGKMFGYERFFNLLARNGGLSNEELVSLTIDEISRWSGRTEFEDDLTMIVIDV